MFVGNNPIRRPPSTAAKDSTPVMRQLSPPVTFKTPAVPRQNDAGDVTSANKHRRTISTQSYDKSYAYGAPANGNETLLRRARSALSPPAESADGHSDVSSTSVAYGSPVVVDPHVAAASARYAKYNNSSFNPGQSTSYAGASQPRPIAMPPKPSEASTKNTSVQIATAFARAHAGSIGVFGRAGDEEQGDTSHDTVLEDSDEMRVDRSDAHVSFDVEEPERPSAESEMEVEQQQPAQPEASTSRGTKRKVRRSVDPSYRPRPGEEETDESEPGEVTSTKRKRAKKAPGEPSSSPAQPVNGQTASEEQSATRKKAGPSSKRKLTRDATWHPSRDGDESDSSSGEELSRQRPRRSAGDRTNGHAHEGELRQVNGVTYRLREPTESTSFSQEEEMVDIEMQRRQALQQQRMHALQQRQQLPPAAASPAPRHPPRMQPPPTPAQMATPYPPGRYAPTPGARSDDDTDANAAPPRPSLGRVAGLKLRQGMLAVVSLLHLLARAVAIPLRLVRWVPLSQLARWATLFVLAASIFAAFTDSRASRGLWRLPLGFKDSPPYQAPSVPADSLNTLISRLSTVERSLASLSAADRSHAQREQADVQDLNRRIATTDASSEKRVDDVQRAVDALKTSLTALTTDVSSDRKMLQSIDDKVQKTAADVDELRDRIAMAESAVRSDKLAKVVGEVVEKILPGRLAVSVDAKTGILDISPAFWDALRAEFMDERRASKLIGEAVARGGKAPASSGGKAPSWSEFLATNEADLDRLLDAKLEEGARTGAILSKAAFRDLLEREIKSQIKAEVRGGLEDRINDNVQDIGRELLGKFEKQQSGLRAKVDALASSTGKTATIKTPSGADLHAVVAEIVDAALLRYTKDVIARADYALYTAGARVVPALTSPTYEVQPSGLWRRALAAPFGVGVIRGRPPVVALHPDTNVGACWSFAGPTAQLGVRLSRTVVAEAIVLEHAPAELEAHRGSAPADFEVWGEVADREAAKRLAMARANGELDSSETTTDAVVSAIPPSPNHVLLVAGRYDASDEAKSHIQTFEISEAVQRLELPVDVVILRILGLHGDRGPGCLYRFRLLGRPVEK